MSDDKPRRLSTQFCIHFRNPIYDIRGNQHPTQKEADQANAVYRLEDQVAALTHSNLTMNDGGSRDAEIERIARVLIAEGMKIKTAVRQAAHEHSFKTEDEFNSVINKIYKRIKRHS